jgi:hypothetical protein
MKNLQLFIYLLILGMNGFIAKVISFVKFNYFKCQRKNDKIEN